MRKIITIIATIMLSSSSLQVIIACTDDSKFKEFTTYVNSNNAFIGILGADDAPLSKFITDKLEYIKLPISNNPNNKSNWDQYLADLQPTINQISNNKTINVYTFIRPSFAKGTVTAGDVAKKLWNDKTISWQKNIYHWLLTHRKSNKDSYIEPVINSGLEIIDELTDANKEFTKLPIVFIINKGKLLTVGQSWNEGADFFDQFKNLINGNLLITAYK